MIDAAQIRLRIPPEADDIIAVSRPARIDLYPVDLSRGAGRSGNGQAVDEISTDRTRDDGSLVINTDHSALKKNVAVGEVVHGVVTDRCHIRHCIVQYDPDHRCRAVQAGHSIGIGQVTYGISGDRLIAIAPARNTIDPAIRIYRCICQVGKGVVRDGTCTVCTLIEDPIYILRTGTGCRACMDTVSGGRTSDGIIVDGTITSRTGHPDAIE